MRATPKRHHDNKHDAARNFRHNTSRTAHKNIAATPRRGGWRL